MGKEEVGGLLSLIWHRDGVFSSLWAARFGMMEVVVLAFGRSIRGNELRCVYSV